MIRKEGFKRANDPSKSVTRVKVMDASDVRHDTTDLVGQLRYSAFKSKPNMKTSMNKRMTAKVKVRATKSVKGSMKPTGKAPVVMAAAKVKKAKAPVSVAAGKKFPGKNTPMEKSVTTKVVKPGVIKNVKSVY